MTAKLSFSIHVFNQACKITLACINTVQPCVNPQNTAFGFNFTMASQWNHVEYSVFLLLCLSLIWMVQASWAILKMEDFCLSPMLSSVEQNVRRQTLRQSTLGSMERLMHLKVAQPASHWWKVHVRHALHVFHVASRLML